jgi:GMP synthase (glutamine-hydrolysing)
VKPGFLIVKTGSAFPTARERFGDFDAWFRRGLGERTFDYRCAAVDQGDPLPDEAALDALAGVVVTGSPAMVSHREAWSERTAGWLREVMAADRLPVLGVCYGHQLMAHALGGRVGPNPFGRRMGTRDLAVLDDRDPLMSVLDAPTRVHVTHLEAVLEPPGGSRVIATTDGDPNHALHFGGRSWGVQFHPEFDAGIMRCYVEGRAELLESEGFDSRAILDAVAPAPAGDALLEAFARLCQTVWEQRHGLIA